MYGVASVRPARGLGALPSRNRDFRGCISPLKSIREIRTATVHRDRRGARVKALLIQPSDNWGMWAALAACGWVGLYSEKASLGKSLCRGKLLPAPKPIPYPTTLQFRVGKELSGALVSTLAALVLSNLGVISTAAPQVRRHSILASSSPSGPTASCCWILTAVRHRQQVPAAAVGPHAPLLGRPAASAAGHRAAARGLLHRHRGHRAGHPGGLQAAAPSVPGGGQLEDCGCTLRPAYRRCV